MKRILIVKLWALGDILMATPLLRALRDAYPGCHISWVVEKAQADILTDNNMVDNVIAFDSANWRRHFRYGRFREYLKITRELRHTLLAQKFDIVINLTAEKWWSVWFMVAPTRIGLFPRPKPGLVGYLYTHAIRRADIPPVHNTLHYLRPAAALGISSPYDERMVIGVSEEAHEEAQQFLRARADHDSSRPLALLHPGTSQQTKCWPTEHYAAVAAALSEKFTVVITGSPKERGLAEDIVAALPPGVAAPRIAAGAFSDIRPTVALIKQASIVVTGDTSALHIASALGTPLVGIYGSTRPRDNVPQFGPRVLLFDDSVPCAPCYQAQCPLRGNAYLRCQHAVTPERALDAIFQLLETSHEPSLAR